MKLSLKVFLLSADDILHALPNAAFMRMLNQESRSRIPAFAGQRVRQASILFTVVNGEPARIVRSTFAILDIDADGVLDVERWNTQQIARVGDLMEPEGPDRGNTSQIINASSRFIARGGAWEPDRRLMHRIEETVLLKRPCPRVKVVH